MSTQGQGNPDEIWVRRKGPFGAEVFRISRLQALEPPVVLVADFREHLQQKCPEYKDISAARILIRQFGSDESPRPSATLTTLGGNTDETAHLVEVAALTPHQIEAASDTVQTPLTKVGKPRSNCYAAISYSL